MKFIEGKTGTWEIVIGMEVHAQVKSESKLFSASSTKFGANPNTQVNLIDAAMPGMLPVINEACIRQAVKTGLALNCQINKTSIFDRKNYFYPDLPQGYQISQYKDPIVGVGYLDINMSDYVKKIGIVRLHLEQDAGKLIHDRSPNETYIDLNRSGVALMEIVSEPDIRGSEEAVEYLRTLKLILEYIDTCPCNMEEGSLRADVNVSVRKNDEKYGTRCEIKNLNSFRYIKQAIEYEAKRQVDLIESGQEVKQQTLLFDPDTGETRPMRSKEDAHDYRYFPDPDLKPLVLSDELIKLMSENIPELPSMKYMRYIQSGISEIDAKILISDINYAKFYDDLVENRDPKICANWVINEYLSRLKVTKDLDITSNEFGELIDLVSNSKLTIAMAKTVLDKRIETKKPILTIIQEDDLMVISDNSLISDVINEVLINNKQQVEEYKSGKTKIYGFLFGKVMKGLSGKADPKTINDLLKTKLEE